MEISGLKSNIAVKVEPEYTGDLVVDIVCGGIPKNRITHLFAPDGIGKTTLALYLFGNMFYIQKKKCEIISELLDGVKNKKTIDLLSLDDKYVFLRSLFKDSVVSVNDLKNEAKEPYFLYIDSEQSFNEEWFKTLFRPNNVEVTVDKGEYFTIVDVDTGKEIGIIIQPFYYEDISNIMTTFEKYCINENKKGYLLWDSVVSPTTIDRESGDNKVGYKATAIQDILDRHDKLLTAASITSIFINQVRDKLQMGMFVKDVSGETSNLDVNVPGGWALKFRSCLSLTLLKGSNLSYGGNINEKKNPYMLKGKVIKLSTGKNKLRGGNVNGTLAFINDYGYSPTTSMLISFTKKIGNVPKELLGREKDMRFIQFMNEMESNNDLVNTFFTNVLNSLVVTYSFVNASKKLLLNKDFYVDIITNDVHMLNNFAKEYAGLFNDVNTEVVDNDTGEILFTPSEDNSVDEDISSNNVDSSIDDESKGKK